MTAKAAVSWSIPTLTHPVSSTMSLESGLWPAQGQAPIPYGDGRRTTEIAIDEVVDAGPSRASRPAGTRGPPCLERDRRAPFFFVSTEIAGLIGSGEHQKFVEAGRELVVMRL